jgi:hypothetical protein
MLSAVQSSCLGYDPGHFYYPLLRKLPGKCWPLQIAKQITARSASMGVESLPYCPGVISMRGSSEKLVVALALPAKQE